MHEWRGKHICEDCGKEYEWIARYREPDEVMIIGAMENIQSHNITNITLWDGKLIATGYCPYCGYPQQRHFVEVSLETLK